MTHPVPQEATRAGLIFNSEVSFENRGIKDILKEAGEAFGLHTTETQHPGDGCFVHVAGPIMIELMLAAEGCRFDIAVTRLRDSEVLHPEAETAILAEVISLIAERIGGDLVDWSAAGVLIDTARFVNAFVPLRQRGGTSRVSPRRVRRGDTRGTPMLAQPVVAAAAPAPVEINDDLRALFADTPDQAPSASTLSTLSTWTATASVGALNPLIGVPLVAYNLTKGADTRVTTHALALSAVMFGVAGGALGYLPSF